jgi:hypothetical protein
MISNLEDRVDGSFLHDFILFSCRKCGIDCISDEERVWLKSLFVKIHLICGTGIDWTLKVGKAVISAICELQDVNYRRCLRSNGLPLQFRLISLEELKEYSLPLFSRSQQASCVLENSNTSESKVFNGENSLTYTDSTLGTTRLCFLGKLVANEDGTLYIMDAASAIKEDGSSLLRQFNENDDIDERYDDKDDEYFVKSCRSSDVEDRTRLKNSWTPMNWTEKDESNANNNLELKKF